MADVFSEVAYQALVGGTGLTVTKYPIDAVGVTLTASGKTTGVYKFAAAGANVAQIVAKAVLLVPWRLAWCGLNTFSATGVFIIRLGRAAGGAVAMTQVLAELFANEISAAGTEAQKNIPWCATVLPNAATDAVVGDAASNNAGADDTVVASVGIMRGMGT